MNWYNIVHPLYDIFTKNIYYKQRNELLENLDLHSGENILSIACGTGLGFDKILDKIGEEGLLVGVDYSAEMLNIAQRKIERNGWKNVYLIHCDAQHISKEIVQKTLGKEVDFDVVVGELAYSVIPNWESAINQSIQLLHANGRIGVLDGFRSRKDIINSILNFFAQSDISRDISSYLEKVTERYWCQSLGRTKILFIGIGYKPDKI